MCEDVAINSMCGVQQDLPVAAVPITVKQQYVVAATLHHLDSTHNTASQCCCTFPWNWLSHTSPSTRKCFVQRSRRQSQTSQEVGDRKCF